MATPSKRKGDRAELEAAQLISDLLGVDCRRKLGAGRTDDTGDLDAPPGSVLDQHVIQVKNYRDIARAVSDGLVDAEQQRQNSGRPFAAAMIRRPGGRWFVAMTPEMYAGLIREAAS